MGIQAKLSKFSEIPILFQSTGKKLSGKKTGFAFCGDQNPRFLQSKEEIGEVYSFL